MTVPVVAPMPKDLDQRVMLRLAREVVMDVRPLHIVLAEFHLDEAQFEVIKASPYFKRVYDSALQDWNSAENTEKRAQLHAAWLVEQALPIIGARISDEKEDLNKCIEGVKVLAKIGKLDVSDKQAGSGEKFSITINMGNDKVLTVEAGAKPVETLEVQPLPQGEGQNKATPLITQVSSNPTPVQSKP